MKIVELSVKRPITMTMLILATVVAGFVSLKSLSIDFLPEVSFPIVTVRTIYPGTGPKEIESLITKKIEDAVSPISGIKKLNSSSIEGVSIAIIQFELGTDVDVVAIEVKDKIGEIRQDLPADAFDPVVSKVDLNAAPVMTMAISGELPISEIYTLVDTKIAERLRQVQGVANVDILGGVEREIIVELDQEKMSAYGLDINTLSNAIRSANMSLPAGRTLQERTETSLRITGEFSNLDEIEAVEINLLTGQKLRLSDVAVVKDDFEEIRQLVRYNGERGVGLSIIKKSDANAVDVATRIKALVSEMKPTLPADIKMDFMLDNSIFTAASIDDLFVNMGIGIFLTGVILYFFLHSMRSVIIVSIGIPTAIVATFTLLSVAGFSMNFMSLMALAISIGVLVSNSIIILENIQRHIEETGDVIQSSINGTSEIAVAVFASTLTNIVVFTPIGTMGGMVGQFFVQFGLTVTFATIMALLGAFTLTPMLSSMLLKKQTATDKKATLATKIADSWDRLYERLSKNYRRFVDAVLSRRLISMGTVLALFFLVVIGIGRYMGAGFFVNSDQGLFSVVIQMPAGTNFDQTNDALSRVEAVLTHHTDIVKKTYTVLGKKTGNALQGSTEGVNIGEIIVDIGDKETREQSVKEFFESLREELATSVPAAKLTISEISPSGGNQSPIQLELLGPNTEHLVAMSDTIISYMRNMGSLVDISSSWESGKPEVQIIPRRELMGLYGTSISQIATTVRAYIDGTVASTYKDNNEEYDIRLRLNDEDKNDLNKLRQLMVKTAVGSVPIATLADIVYAEGPTQINRKDKQQMITVKSNIGSGASGTIIGHIREFLDKLEWPDGTSYFFAGQEETRVETGVEIGSALMLALLLTYMLMAAILESFIEPILIMATVPLALMGVILGLVLTNNPMDMFSMMAVVMLVGIVVNNAILILDYVHLLRKEGVDLREALLRSCEVKLRPIIMTNLAISLAMLPLALGIGTGAEMRAPMAIVSIGGIITSTVLTLVVIPILYFSYENFKEKRQMARA
jgi:HAE1 family hydrophobic/amphiphilic exporter-1